MRIDCEQCPERRGDEACEDCLVTFVLELEDGATVEADDVLEGDDLRVDAQAARAIRALREAGLVENVRVLPLEEAG